MRSTFDLPDDLVKRAKIAAVKRGVTLRDLVAEGLRRVLNDKSTPQHRRMTSPPVELPAGSSIPLRSNRELAEILEQEDVSNLDDVYRRR
jgi:hypothetical protein